MKFKLLGNQDMHLDDTAYWVGGYSDGNCPPDEKRTPPINGVIDWPIEHLKQLAKYAAVRADALSGSGVDSDTYTKSEVRSMRSLAKRIRKAIAKTE